MKYLILLVIVLLIAGCEPLLGTHNYSYYSDNYSGCEELCLTEYEHMNCSSYWYEWHEVNKTGNCTYSVSYCFGIK